MTEEQKNPFRFLNSLLKGNDYIEIDETNEEEYWPQFINVGLSQHVDCILHANEMNLHPFLKKKAHYDYLFYSIRKTSRKYGKWATGKITPEEEAVANHFQIRTSLAKDYLKLLNREQIVEICGQFFGRSYGNVQL